METNCCVVDCPVCAPRVPHHCPPCPLPHYPPYPYRLPGQTCPNCGVWYSGYTHVCFYWKPSWTSDSVSTTKTFTDYQIYN